MNTDNDEICLFIKLRGFPNDEGYYFNGFDTIWAYLKNQDLNGYTWFSMPNPSKGIEEDQLHKLNSLASQNKLKIYFGLNEPEFPYNDIAYTANVMEVVTFKGELTEDSHPDIDPTECPKEFNGWEHIGWNRTWIKIYNLHKENGLSASDFVVQRNNNNLKVALESGQTNFAYIVRA